MDEEKTITEPEETPEPSPTMSRLVANYEAQIEALKKERDDALALASDYEATVNAILDGQRDTKQTDPDAFKKSLGIFK